MRTTEYESSRAISFSRVLKPLMESDAAAWQSWFGPYVDTDTPDRTRCRLTHAAILEGDDAIKRFSVYDGRRDKRDKAYLAALGEAVLLGGGIPLKPTEVEAAISTATAVRATIAPELQKWRTGQNGDLGTVSAEVTLQWSELVAMSDDLGVRPVGYVSTVPKRAVDCKGIIDGLIIDGDGYATIIDCKEVPTLKRSPLAAHIARSGYHVQAAHYMAGLRAKMPRLRGVRFVWICYLGKSPHEPTVVWLSDESLDAAREHRTALLRRAINLQDRGEPQPRWPHGLEIDLPHWALDSIDEGVINGLD